MPKWTRPPGYQADGSEILTVSCFYLYQVAEQATGHERAARRFCDDRAMVTARHCNLQARIRREHIARILADVRNLRIREQTKK